MVTYLVCVFFSGVKEILSGLFCTAVSLILACRPSRPKKLLVQPPALTDTALESDGFNDINADDIALVVTAEPTSSDRKYVLSVLGIVVGLLFYAANRFCMGLASHLPKPADVSLLIGCKFLE